MKRFAASLAACALLATAGAASAGQLIDVAVIDRSTGQRIQVYQQDGRLYVPGAPGNRYAVSITNKTSGRVLTVLSVDGINAVTGDTASTDQAGYVLGPYQSFEINGWRKSLNEVAAFYFTQLPDSYAARTNRPDNVGVIGVTVFRESVPPRAAITRAPRARADGAAREADSRTADAAAPSALPAEPQALRRQEKIGTGHGERERSDVAYTDFRRATSHPAETITVYYDTRANLVARGVIPGPTPVVEPNPFPGGRFVPDPRT